MRYEPGLSVWLFGGLWCLLFGFVGLGLVLFLARIFSVTLFNSIKVTCASRHTQRLRSCKKTGHAATSGHTASGHGHAHPATATDTATRPRPRPHGHPAMAIRPRPRPRGKKNPSSGLWHIGTASIRGNSQAATGLRFVNWQHHANDDASRMDPPPGPTIQTYSCIEQWLPRSYYTQ